MIDVFGSSSYWPLGLCMQWTPDLIWVLALSNAATGFAYLAIAPQMRGLYRDRPKGPRLAMMVCLISFILACGIGRLMVAVIIWIPMYHLLAGWSVLTALISVISMVVIPLATAASQRPPAPSESSRDSSPG